MSYSTGDTKYEEGIRFCPYTDIIVATSTFSPAKNYILDVPFKIPIDGSFEQNDSLITETRFPIVDVTNTSEDYYLAPWAKLKAAGEDRARGSVTDSLRKFMVRATGC